MRRVVVTGLGLVTPLGRGIDTNWEKLIKGESGVKVIDKFDPSDLSVKIAGQVPVGEKEGEFDINSVVSTKDQRKMDLFIAYGLGASIDAVEDSGWKPETEEEKCRTGVLIGSGIGGIDTIYKTSVTLKEKGPRRVSPFFIPATLINLVSGHLSIKYGFKGPNHAVVTACSTGTHAIGDAARLIGFGDADVMIAGGAEAAVCPLALTGFANAKAVTTSFNEDPTKASRPWDKNRSGFVMGEGSGVVVLEEYEHAKARGAKIYGEVAGYGLSGDAYHITAPATDGDGAFRAMQAALKNSGLKKEDVDYINAHGTSTPAGDEIELKAVKKLFGDHASNLCMSSTKSSTGHLLGAAGAVEAIYSILAMNKNIAPPTLNLEDPCDSLGIDLVPLKAKEKEINCIMSNSFGFGGTNSSVIIKSVD
jgi:3-oxoacyl-[acyl-carrier-protein] synthase II